MSNGDVRVFTDGQGVAAQVAGFTSVGPGKVLRDVAIGIKDDRTPPQRAVEQRGPGNVLISVQLDRVARPAHGLLNTLDTITDPQTGFCGLGDTWADTTTPYGRLMLSVLGGLAVFKRELIRVRARGKRRDGALMLVSGCVTSREAIPCRTV